MQIVNKDSKNNKKVTLPTDYLYLIIQVFKLTAFIAARRYLATKYKVRIMKNETYTNFIS